MSLPPAERWFEDYPVGLVDEFGEVAVSARDIVEFARRFDPQPMHTSARELIASGWHTAAMVMRLFVEHFLSKVAALPSPGIDELRWLRPVCPGDLLRVRVTVTEARRSRSKPDRGIIQLGRGDQSAGRRCDELPADEPVTDTCGLSRPGRRPARHRRAGPDLRAGPRPVVLRHVSAAARFPVP